MPATMTVQNGFSRRTTTSDRSADIDSTSVGTRTQQIQGMVVYFAATVQPACDLPEGTLTIGDYIEKQEQVPDRSAAIEAAREWASNSTAGYSKNNLRTLRLQKSFSQARLATAAGTTQSHIARIESGKCDVQVGTIVRVASALGIAPTVAFEAFVANMTADE